MSFPLAVASGTCWSTSQCSMILPSSFSGRCRRRPCSRACSWSGRRRGRLRRSRGAPRRRPARRGEALAALDRIPGSPAGSLERRLNMQVSTPATTSGTIAVPADGHTTVFVDGRLAWNGLEAKAYRAYQARPAAPARRACALGSSLVRENVAEHRARRRLPPPSRSALCASRDGRCRCRGDRRKDRHEVSRPAPG
jgi:hypothetical protein